MANVTKSRENVMSAKALLVDLDGTLYFQGQPIPGACQALARLREMGYLVRLLSNTDSIPPYVLHQRVEKLGFQCDPSEIITPISLAAIHFRRNPDLSFLPLVSESVQTVFEGMNVVDSRPDRLLIGDCRERISYAALNDVYRALTDRTEIVATQMGRFFYNDKGPNLDTGCFVRIFEHALAKDAAILGKPGKMFFDVVLMDLGLGCSDVVVVGDDVTTDIRGASAMGMRSVLVRTGKYTPAGEASLGESAIPVVPSFADLPELLQPGE